MKFPNGERSCERLPLHRREDMMKEGASISFGGGGESGKGADRTLEGGIGIARLVLLLLGNSQKENEDWSDARWSHGNFGVQRGRTVAAAVDVESRGEEALLNKAACRC